jgi:hypothetical protein
MKTDLKEHIKQRRDNYRDDLSINGSKNSRLSKSRLNQLDSTSEIKPRSTSTAAKTSSNFNNIFLKPHKEHFYRLLRDEHLEDNNK